MAESRRSVVTSRRRQVEELPRRTRPQVYPVLISFPPPMDLRDQSPTKKRTTSDQEVTEKRSISGSHAGRIRSERLTCSEGSDGQTPNASQHRLLHRSGLLRLLRAVSRLRTREANGFDASRAARFPAMGPCELADRSELLGIESSAPEGASNSGFVFKRLAPGASARCASSSLTSTRPNCSAWARPASTKYEFVSCSLLNSWSSNVPLRQCCGRCRHGSYRDRVGA